MTSWQSVRFGILDPNVLGFIQNKTMQQLNESEQISGLFDNIQDFYTDTLPQIKKAGPRVSEQKLNTFAKGLASIAQKVQSTLNNFSYHEEQDDRLVRYMNNAQRFWVDLMSKSTDFLNKKSPKKARLLIQKVADQMDKQTTRYDETMTSPLVLLWHALNPTSREEEELKQTLADQAGAHIRVIRDIINEQK